MSGNLAGGHGAGTAPWPLDDAVRRGPDLAGEASSDLSAGTVTGPLRIVQMIDRLERPGGAEALMVTLAEALRHQPVKLTFVTIKPSDPGMIREIEKLGADVVPFTASKLVHPARFAELCRFLGRQGIDLIHTHLTGATILGALAGAWTRIPVVTTIHNTVFRADRHLYHGRLECWLLRHVVREVIGVGRETARITRTRLKGRDVLALANAVCEAPVLDQGQQARLRAEMGMSPERKDGVLLVWAGRMTEQKGLPDLLAAFTKLSRTHPHVHLALAGDGDLADGLRSRAEVHGITDRVSFLGLRTDVPSLFAAADLYVSSSHWEGFPVATLEAMAAGLPVVATAVGDVPTILEGDVGIILPPHRPDLLTDSLAQVIDDVPLRHLLGHRAKARIDRDYRANAWAEAHLNLYRRVLIRT
ncbi:MAG: glycosyltransferase [Geminicoccaceae bacterium]